ncbi:MAG: hypothetical protein ACYTDT_10080 [Planctomycetota bacterium]|jgi:hypothetical protein
MNERRKSKWKWLVIALVGTIVAIGLSGFGHTGHPAIRPEAEAVAGILKGQLRTLYAETEEFPKTGDMAVGLELAKAPGEYVSHATYELSDDQKGVIRVYMKEPRKDWLESRFDYKTGDATFNWHDD